MQNYYSAVEKSEALAGLQRAFKEEDIQLLHGLSYEGKAKPTPYRDGQNVIRNSGDGSIGYIPPEAGEVPTLMAELVMWINEEIETKCLPIPVVAALAHYQFATIHPYYDGNGRVSRLLATMILYRCGYGLKGIYSLEEYYGRNLSEYYDALTVGPSHNYRLGRTESDVTGFVQYFCVGMAEAFLHVELRAEKIGGDTQADQGALLRELRPLQRQALGLFVQSRVVTVGELSEYLGIAARRGRDVCAKWVEEGFLVVENPSKKARSYRLADRFEEGVM